jgi:TatD DNase family protein
MDFIFWKIFIAIQNWIGFTSIPNNRFFLETDTVEETIREVYTLAAKYKNITVTEIQKNNFN